VRYRSEVNGCLLLVQKSLANQLKTHNPIRTPIYRSHSTAIVWLWWQYLVTKINNINYTVSQNKTSPSFISRILVKHRSIFNVRQKTDARYSYRLDVRLSVRLSVRHTLVLCQNGSTYRQTVFTAWWSHDSSFMRTKIFPGIPMGTPPTGTLNARGVGKKLQFQTNISL